MQCLVLGLCLALLQSGCMSPEQGLDERAVKQRLHDGQTKEEVRRVFGTQTKHQAGPNGNELDAFVQTIKSPATDVGQPVTWEVRTLYVLYGKDGRVIDFSHYVGHISGVTVRYGDAWHVGRVLEMKKVNQIQRNITSRDDLIRLFGPATYEGLDLDDARIMQWDFYTGKEMEQGKGRRLAARLNSNSVVTTYLLEDIQP